MLYISQPRILQKFLCRRPVSQIQLHNLTNECPVFLGEFLILRLCKRLSFLIVYDVLCSITYKFPSLVLFWKNIKVANRKRPKKHNLLH